MRGIQRVSTKGMSREEWLMRRRKTIGGSDAAGIGKAIHSQAQAIHRVGWRAWGGGSVSNCPRRNR